MLSLFTGLEQSPECYQPDGDFVWRGNGCAVFYMPLLIFSRSTLTSLSKDNWQFTTPLFHLMSQMGGAATAAVVAAAVGAAFKPQASEQGAETRAQTHTNTLQSFPYPG